MTTTTNPRKQTALELVTRLLARLRNEKNPPFARYAITCAAAQNGDAGATVREIATAIDDAIAGGSIYKVEDAGFIAALPGVSPKRWVPTEKGRALIQSLLR